MTFQAYYAEQVRLAKLYLKIRWSPERAAMFYLICAWHFAKAKLERNHV